MQSKPDLHMASDLTREDAFLAMLGQYKALLYKVARLYCKDAHEHNDLVQEMIFQLWRSFDRYQPAYKPSTWIYRIALNTAISNYRKTNTAKSNTLPLDESVLTIHDSSRGTAEDENIQLLYDYIERLKPLDKALMLLYLEGQSHRDIAEIIGITESNVGTKINRIKKTIIEYFSTQS